MLSTHYLYGALFENLVISEIIKWQVHAGKRPSVYYWRESNGSEIDCIIESANGIIAIEIKAGMTFTADFLRNLKLFPSEEKKKRIRKMLIYGGTDESTISGIEIISWNKFVDSVLSVQ